MAKEISLDWSLWVSLKRDSQSREFFRRMSSAFTDSGISLCSKSLEKGVFAPSYFFDPLESIRSFEMIFIDGKKFDGYDSDGG